MMTLDQLKRAEQVLVKHFGEAALGTIQVEPGTPWSDEGFLTLIPSQTVLRVENVDRDALAKDALKVHMDVHWPDTTSESVKESFAEWDLEDSFVAVVF